MKLLIGLALVLFSSLSFAHGGGFSTKEFCSTTSPKSCAHAHFHEAPNTSEASEFLVHVEGVDESTIFTEVQVELQMVMPNGHTHGTSPVTVTPSDEENHFEVKDAFFSMVGNWNIVIKFNDNNALQTVIIPLEIKE